MSIILKERAEANKYILNVFLSIVVVLLPAMFFADGLSKILFIQGSDFSRISLIVRSLFEIVVVAYLFRHVNNKILFNITLLILLLIFFVVGQISIGNINNITENFITYNKYIFLILTYLFFEKVLFLETKKQNVVFTVLKYLFVINVVFVFLGVLFSINIFESYFAKSYRFGYNGVYTAPNESSFIIISMISFFYFRTYYQGYRKSFLLMFILAGLLSGTKAVYLFLVLLFMFHIVHNMKRKYLIIVVILGIVLSIYIIRLIQSEEFKSMASLFIRLYEEKGLWHMLLTGRDDILSNESTLVFKNWSFLNYLIGGVNIKTYSMEMDLFDLFMFFGALGTIVYLYMFYELFVKLLLRHKFFLFYIFSILLISFFGGHFLYSPSSATYFSLVVLYFQNYTLNNISNNK